MEFEIGERFGAPRVVENSSGDVGGQVGGETARREK